MIIYSDILNKRFNTPEECLVEEEKYLAEQKKKEEADAKRVEEIKELIGIAAEAIKDADDAIEKAADALSEYRVDHPNGDVHVLCVKEMQPYLCRALTSIARLDFEKRHHKQAEQ